MPSLFGLLQSNRDFTQKESWGKNQFNTAFPTALACYMYDKSFDAIYLKLNGNSEVTHSTISFKELFKAEPFSKELFFAFESDFSPYRPFVTGNLPRIDLVTQNVYQQTCLSCLEIKLTALPDNSTCELSDNQFGCELVVRPDSIVYLALSIVKKYQQHIEKLKCLIGNTFDKIEDWSDGQNIAPYLRKMIEVLDKILLVHCPLQEPLVMQPVWKTRGKSPQLAENCLDIFVWSNVAFAQLFLKVATTELRNEKKLTRQLRSIVWLLKMLIDFCENYRIDHTKIIDELSYNTKNDKAFAVSGKVSHTFMTCPELTCPRISKQEIKNIILDGGHLLLSPERRFDAILYNSPMLFE